MDGLCETCYADIGELIPISGRCPKCDQDWCDCCKTEHSCD